MGLINNLYMKLKIKDIDNKVLSLRGQTITAEQNKELTYRDLLIITCELYNPQSGTGDKLKAFNIGLKIVNAIESVELEEEEVTLLKEIIINTQTFSATIVGRLDELLNKATKL